MSQAIRIVVPQSTLPRRKEDPIILLLIVNGKELHVNEIFAGFSITWTDNVVLVREKGHGPEINDELLRSREIQELRERNFLVEMITE